MEAGLDELQPQQRPHREDRRRREDGEVNTWFVGPYGSTRAGQVAYSLESDARDYPRLESRECTVEALFSDDECLRVADYGRDTHGSLR